MLKRILLALSLLGATAAYAQYVNTWPTGPAGQGGTVTGGVGLCLNTSGYAVPCSASTPTYTAPASADPCSLNAHTVTPISITSATTTNIVAGTASKKTWICSISLSTGIADNVGIVEGTGATCGTGTAGVIGGTTAANGINLAANGTFSLGNSTGTIAATAVAADNLCLITSSVGPLSGAIVTVQQ